MSISWASISDPTAQRLIRVEHGVTLASNEGKLWFVSIAFTNVEKYAECNAVHFPVASVAQKSNWPPNSLCSLSRPNSGLPPYVSSNVDLFDNRLGLDVFGLFSTCEKTKKVHKLQVMQMTKQCRILCSAIL